MSDPLRKPLSLLCAGLEDVAKYTQGLASGALPSATAQAPPVRARSSHPALTRARPAGAGPGQPNLFRIAKACLPGGVRALCARLDGRRALRSR